MEDKKLSPAKYTPGFEEDIYRRWSDKGFFHSEISDREPFTIVIPPPNITGFLHMGHALNNVLQDILIRYSILSGKGVRWVPGTDHGGIATQNVVEKELRKKGSGKRELGREKFLEYMNGWKEKYGGRILEQLKILGSACDWSVLRFTMDEVCSRAVQEAFVRLYEEGRIYRGYRLINYCIRCETSLSDIEVEYSEEKGKLWFIKYPFAPLENSLTGQADEPGNGITVATTRPETMLGDTAVAVNPGDGRYKNCRGKFLTLPVAGRRIPVVYDERVEMDFGTGAVKVTPAHDFADFEIGKTHGLESVKVIDEKGLMTREAGDAFFGLTRNEAREHVCRLLEEQGFLVKTEELAHSVSVCYRCGEPVEPLLSLQWFLKMDALAIPAIDAARRGEVKFYPRRWQKPFLNFLENIHDWCLSRQIWWGHRLPVYYCRSEKCGKMKKGIIVSREKPAKCPFCGSTGIVQDEDVLDTWFSSALWPFEVFGWPEETAELKYYYPTSVLVTGHEILYLWVARMVMMGLKFAGKIPFKDVYIHGIVRDKLGKKMSKSLGNTIDPLDVTGRYGVDSLRYTVTKQAVAGHDLLISDENFVSSRNFMNKIWNAANVVLKYGLDRSVDFDSAEGALQGVKFPADRWILTEFSALLSEIDAAFLSYDLSKYARLIYEFFWSKFCDWWLEILKRRGDNSGGALAYYLFRNVLVVMHPVIPFITEKIYGRVRLRTDPESILNCSWPQLRFEDKNSCSSMSEIFTLIQGVRNIRSRLNIPASSRVRACVDTDGNLRNVISQAEFFILPLAGVKDIVFESKRIPQSSSFASSAMKCSVPLSGIVDIAAETKKINGEITEINVQISKLEKLLANEKFIKSAGEKIIRQKKELLETFTAKKENLFTFLKSLEQG
ncbi:MAG: valine--tRNA ligase [bacterium]